MGKTKAELNFAQKRPVIVFEGLLGLFLAYLLVSRALDTGSWWEYLGTTILVIVSIRLILKSFRDKKQVRT